MKPGMLLAVFGFLVASASATRAGNGIGWGDPRPYDPSALYTLIAIMAFLTGIGLSVFATARLASASHNAQLVVSLGRSGKEVPLEVQIAASYGPGVVRLVVATILVVLGSAIVLINQSTLEW